MLYEYHCSKCRKSFDLPFPMGKAQSLVQCPTCKRTAKRMFQATPAILKGSGWTPKGTTFGDEQARKNSEAAERMKGHKPPVRRVATDYGNGDVRGVAE